MAHLVLFVEDDPAIRAPTAEILRDEGYEVAETDSGESALVEFDRRPADCVLVDLMLPGMDGFDTCRALRQRSDVPIIIVTARSDDFDVVAGLESGADDYVIKPFEPKVLVARIRASLRRARGFGASERVDRAGRQGGGATRRGNGSRRRARRALDANRVPLAVRDGRQPWTCVLA